MPVVVLIMLTFKNFFHDRKKNFFVHKVGEQQVQNTDVVRWRRTICWKSCFFIRVWSPLKSGFVTFCSVSKDDSKISHSQISKHIQLWKNSVYVPTVLHVLAYWISKETRNKKYERTRRERGSAWHCIIACISACKYNRARECARKLHAQTDKKGEVKPDNATTYVPSFVREEEKNDDDGQLELSEGETKTNGTANGSANGREEKFFDNFYSTEKEMPVFLEEYLPSLMRIE